MSVPKTRLLFVNRFQHFPPMVVHIHFGEHLADDAFRVDEEGGAGDAQRGFPATRLFAVDAVERGDGGVGVGDEREGQAELGR